MYHIIVNPASRSGRGMRIWKKKIKPALQDEGIAYKCHFSKKSGDAAKTVRNIFSKASGESVSLIVLGGDGTMNEVVQGIPETGDAVVGYIPTGSSNDLARDLDIPSSPMAALDLILHTGRPHPMDVGVITYTDGTRQRFCVSCGLGYDAAVCEEAQRSQIKSALNRLGLGKLTYLGIALKQLFTAKAVSGRLTLDNDQTVDIGNMLFTAGMIHRFEGGGFKFCPDADDGDGYLDLCAVGDIPKPLILFALPTAFVGKHYRFKGVTPYRTRQFVLETGAPLWAHTDGEVSRKTCKITVSCMHHALQIIRPDVKP